MGSISLKTGRDKSLLRRHPWVFSGAVRKTDAPIGNGETIDIFSKSGKRLAIGAYSEHSQIIARIWSFDPEEKIDSRFFRRRLERAIEARSLLGLQDTCTAYRLVNAESDGLPGIIVDRYGDFLVCQFLSAGAEFWKQEITRQLSELIPVAGIYERSDGSGRIREGMKPSNGVLLGQTPPERIEIHEGPLRFLVDIRNGHKTGFYLDQRENRAAVLGCSKGCDVLNCFAYTGGFGLFAHRGGARNVTNIEMSKSALSILRQNMEINGMDPSNTENTTGDVFEFLRKYRDSGRQFDMVILDPPKFAQSAHQVKKAARGYKDINLLAAKLIKPGGVLFTFSCSGHIPAPLFQKIVADAALDSDRQLQIIRYLSQAPDHPVALNYPEGHYLKGLLCRVW
jgi:23S rRNA (cytosine1962-C5)-methyltransferase